MKCFVIAMESEAAPVLGAMDGLSEREICGIKTYGGTIGGEKICAVTCGVGKVNAAAGATLAVRTLGADTVVNIGTAGAVSDRCAVGEIYGISEAVQFDFDLSQLNRTPVGTLDGYTERMLPLATPEIYPLRRIGTADRFNDSRDDFLLLTRDMGADIRDMECGAVAQVCLMAGVPLYAFKVITDSALCPATGEQFRKNLGMCVGRLGDAAKKIIRETGKW